MRLGGKVHDGIRPVLCQQLGDQGLIADIALHKNMLTIGLQVLEVFAMTGIGQQIEIDDASQTQTTCGEYKVCADKASAAGNKPSLHAGVPVGIWKNGRIRPS